MEFKYKETVLAELARHGIKPARHTSPELIYGYLNDLYLYEIRALRNRMRAGLIPKDDYRNHVIELRKRYPVLSLPVRHWTEEE